MDFYGALEHIEEGQTVNPFAGKDEQGNWIEGTVSVDFLNAVFGKYSTATEMKNATTSEGLKMFFDWLVEQGKLTN